MKPSRRPKNLAEGEAYDALIAAGWTITKRGCPDFFLFKESLGHEDFMCVECKKPNVPLKTAQVKVMRALLKKGVSCAVWRRGLGLEALTLDHPLLNPPEGAAGQTRGE